MSIEDRGRLAGQATVATFETFTNVGRGYDALVRRRRTQRRTRTLALAVVAVAAVVAFFSAHGALRAGPTPRPPVQPSPTHGLGLTAPLIAPTSLLDVRTLGFHVGPVAGFDPEGLAAGWSIDNEGQTVTLRWDEVADKVDVTVLYQGQPSPLALAAWGHVETITIHGAPGHYADLPGGRYGVGGFDAAVAWEYAPGSWASVSAHSDRGDPGRQRLRAALIEVAEAVAAGGDPVRVPLRLNGPPTSLMPVTAPGGPGGASSALRGVGMHNGGSGWEARLDFAMLGITAGAGAVPQACELYGGGIERFMYQGHAGCVNGEGASDQPPPGTAFNSVYAIALQVGDTVREVVVPSATGDWFSYHINEWKQVLAELSVAPLDDQSTWVDVKAAVGA